MNHPAQDTANSAAAGQQDISQMATSNQPRLETSTNSEGRIILRMAQSKPPSHPVNGFSTAAPVESTEKSDISKEVKPRRSRNTKTISTPQPTRRSTRHRSEKAGDDRTTSTEQSLSSQVTESVTNTTKSKSRATQNQSISPPLAASNNSTSSQSTKRKAVELDDAESLNSLTSTDDENDIRYFRKSSNTGRSAKKQGQQKSRSLTPSAPDRSPNGKSSASEMDFSPPVVENQDEATSSPVSYNEDAEDEWANQFREDLYLGQYAAAYGEEENEGRDTSRDRSDSPSIPASEASSMGGKRKSAPGYRRKSRSVPASEASSMGGERKSAPGYMRKSPSVPASEASIIGGKRKSTHGYRQSPELEEEEGVSTSHAVNGETVQDAPDDVSPSKRRRLSSDSSSLSVHGDTPIAIASNASDGDHNDAAIDVPDVDDDVENCSQKKRGRPTANRQNTRIKKVISNALKKPAPAGRKKKTSENAETQASYDRMVELKKSYRDMAKRLKPALAGIADKSTESMMEDPKAHEKVPGFRAVMTGLDSIQNAYLTSLDQQHEIQRNHAEKKMRQEIEYSELKLKDAFQDILERSIARVKDAFVKMHKVGIEVVAEDDHVSVDENHDTNLRDLNAFNVPENATVFAPGFDIELPGIGTPRKSPSKKRGQVDPSFSEMAAGTAPIAKHSLLAVTQENEPSSMPPSRVATPEPVETGKFDEHGVHIPNKIRRGRMIEPNNRAIVKSWIDYDEWDIQQEVMNSKKKAKNQPGKSTDMIYLDQTSFTSQGGGGYKLGTHRPEDFDQETIKLYGLHPSYGIPIKGAKNPDISPTDFSKRLDLTRPVVVIDAEESRLVSPGGTRKSAELPEPLELSRSTSLIHADRTFEEFENRQRMVKILDAYDANYPSVKGFATYDGPQREEQLAADWVEDVLGAHETMEVDRAKEASAAAAAAAAHIAHKSSINAIVNSEDGDITGGQLSQAKKGFSSRAVNAYYAYYNEGSMAGMSAFLEAIEVDKTRVSGVPPSISNPGSQARDHRSQNTKAYSDNGGYRERTMAPPPAQPYVQQQAPMPQQAQAPMQQHTAMPYLQAPVPQQVGPYSTSPYSQAGPYNGGVPTLLQQQMMQTMHPRTISQSPYYSQPPQPQHMGPPRAYSQFNHYIPQPARPLDHSQMSRPQRELRPAPPQTEYVNPRQQPDTAQFYRDRNTNPTQVYQGTPYGHGHYQAAPSPSLSHAAPAPAQPTAHLPPPAWAQIPMQQGPPLSQAQHQNPLPRASNNHYFVGTGPLNTPPIGTRHVASTGVAHGEGGSAQKKFTQNQS